MTPYFSLRFPPIISRIVLRVFGPASLCLGAVSVLAADYNTAGWMLTVGGDNQRRSCELKSSPYFYDEEAHPYDLTLIFLQLEKAYPDVSLSLSAQTTLLIVGVRIESDLKGSDWVPKLTGQVSVKIGGKPMTQYLNNDELFQSYHFLAAEDAEEILEKHKLKDNRIPLEISIGDSHSASTEVGHAPSDHFETKAQMFQYCGSLFQEASNEE